MDRGEYFQEHIIARVFPKLALFYAYGIYVYTEILPVLEYEKADLKEDLM